MICFCANRISLIFNLYKSERKKIIDKTPLVGGLALFIPFTLIYFFKPEMLNGFFPNPSLILFFTIALIFFIGLIDDSFNLPYLFRLISVYTTLLIYFYFDDQLLIENLLFETINKNFYVKDISLFLTPLFIVILLNSLNLADGINGNSILIFFIFFSTLILKNDLNLNNYILFLFVNLIIILYFNLKNKLYLGDSGIYFLSIILSLFILNIYKENNNLSCESIFLILMIPGIDMLRVFLERIFNKQNPFKGDKRHLHHLFVKKFSDNLSLLLIFILLIISQIFVFIDNKIFSILIISSIYLGIVYKLKN